MAKKVKYTDAEILKGVAARIKKLEKYKTSKGVAKFLASQGIKGKRGRASECALAVYINFGCSVDGMCVSYPESMEVHEASEVLPSACEKFVEEFDEGTYVDLILAPKGKRAVHHTTKDGDKLVRFVKI